MTQAQHFENRLAELREYRAAERAAVRELERVAHAQPYDPTAFVDAETSHQMWLAIVRRAAEELGKVYYEN